MTQIDFSRYYSIIGIRIPTMLKNKNIIFVSITMLFIVMSFVFTTGNVFAVVAPPPGGGGTTPTPTVTTNTQTPIVSATDACTSSSKCCNGQSCDLIQEYINPTIDFLAAGVGIVVVIMMVIGGIQYITSQDNPQAVSAAKSRIVNALFALLLFAFMYAMLQWLVPGGILNG